MFVGAIAEKKLDFELLAGLAAARPDWTFALIGPVGLGDPGTDVSALAALPNVHLLGARPQAAPARGAARRRGRPDPVPPLRLTESIFPMKVYEYLAAGLPVVATGLPALEGVDGVDARGRRRRRGRRGRARRSREDSPERRRARSEAVREHSWEARLRRDRRGPAGMSDLIVSSLTPTLTSGTGLRTYGVAAALARHRPVEIAYVVWGADRPAAEYAQLANVTLRPLRVDAWPGAGAGVCASAAAGCAPGPRAWGHSGARGRGARRSRRTSA